MPAVLYQLSGRIGKKVLARKLQLGEGVPAENKWRVYSTPITRFFFPTKYAATEPGCHPVPSKRCLERITGITCPSAPRRKRALTRGVAQTKIAPSGFIELNGSLIQFNRIKYAHQLTNES